MANSAMAVLTLMSLGLAAALFSAAAAQKCDCPAGYCCSQFGYCGTTSAYCAGSGGGGGGGSGSGGLSSNVTDAFFNGIKSQSSGGCAGQSFYTRQAFLTAARMYPAFGSGSSDAGKREIAAFFAHVTHETGRKFSCIQVINKLE
jgi:chitinase